MDSDRLAQGLGSPPFGVSALEPDRSLRAPPLSPSHGVPPPLPLEPEKHLWVPANADFHLFGVEPAHYVPVEPSFPFSHSRSRFDHIQARAIAFDQSLESPLGESPLVYAGAQSVSPQFSCDGFWSPLAPDLAGAGTPAISPLLLDNLGLGQLAHQQPGGGGQQCGPSVDLFGERDFSTLDGLVSRYLPQTSATCPPQNGETDLRLGAAFSPVMSQKTFENLFEDCPVGALPPLPTLPTTNSVAEPIGEDEEEAETRRENSGDDPEWTPDPVAARGSSTTTRSTRRSARPSLACSATRRSRSSYAPPVLPPDAPIQPRTYHTESRTSRKPIPQAVLRRHARSLEAGRAASSPPPSRDALEDEAARRRRMNTLSARESRRRKAEAVEEQAKENGKLREENAWLRTRVGELDRENGALRERVCELERSTAVDAGWSGPAPKRKRTD
ncbi:hypothetical protein JCM11491_000246 [Sporobolomyces phaffii]